MHFVEFLRISHDRAAPQICNDLLCSAFENLPFLSAQRPFRVELGEHDVDLQHLAETIFHLRTRRRGYAFELSRPDIGGFRQRSVALFVKAVQVDGSNVSAACLLISGLC